MSPARPAAHGLDAPHPRPGPFRSSPPPARRSARSRRASGRLQTMLYRHRWLRWAAAGAAALAILAALSDDPAGPTPAATETPPAGPAGLLPPHTRGVPIPVDSAVFAVGDAVDVHAILDGAAVVLGAPVVETGEGEVVVAVPAEQVDATVDALTTGGVILVLVPHPGSTPPG